MQAALRKQQAFEEWALNPEAQETSRQQGQFALQQYEQELSQVEIPLPQIDPATGQDMAPQPQLPTPPSPTKFTPLVWRSWYDPFIHRQEFMKWANSDRMVELMKKNQMVEKLLDAHLQEIDAAITQRQAAMASPGAPPSGPGGAGMAMQNSNVESGGTQNASDHTQRPQEGV